MGTMETWIPIIATLLGTLIGGSISLFAQKISASQQASALEKQLTEQRAQWAIERKMIQFEELFEKIEEFSEATMWLRVRKARERNLTEHAIPIPDWVPDANPARTAFEETLWALKKQIMLTHENLSSVKDSLDTKYRDWMLSEDEDANIKALQGLENEIGIIRNRIVELYQVTFEDRKNGQDLAPAHPIP